MDRIKGRVIQAKFPPAEKNGMTRKREKRLMRRGYYGKQYL
ncbi:hypothetical protein [Ruminococcus sp. Marseille-P6503]|nr:hypothetical protein [Ruminococcus sp. Marseille-P6503]